MRTRPAFFHHRRRSYPLPAPPSRRPSLRLSICRSEDWIRRPSRLDRWPLITRYRLGRLSNAAIGARSWFTPGSDSGLAADGARDGTKTPRRLTGVYQHRRFRWSALDHTRSVAAQKRNNLGMITCRYAWHERDFVIYCHASWLNSSRHPHAQLIVFSLAFSRS